MGMVLLATQARAQFPNDNFVENATGATIYFRLSIVPTNCFGSPGTINDDCLQVAANSTADITAIPSGSVAARVRVYCSNPCTSTYAGLVCTSSSTSGSCGGTAFTLDADWTNNIFRAC